MESRQPNPNQEMVTTFTGESNHIAQEGGLVPLDPADLPPLTTLAKCTTANIGTVPLRSPFRYPGGKTWMVPKVRSWLASLPQKPAFFIEPYCGGGIVGLTVAFEGMADHVILAEKDENIAAVWETILIGDIDWLTNRISKFDVTFETVTKILASKPRLIKTQAFKTIVTNRVRHGGVMAPGAGILKNGENGKGLRSRWYPQTLINRMRNIRAIADRITFIHGDAMAVLHKYHQAMDVAWFIDPPYTAPGKRAGVRLYQYNEIDHNALFAAMETIKGQFMATYDNAEMIHNLAAQHRLDTATVTMKNTHHERLTELVIGRDLNWVQTPTIENVETDATEYVPV